MRMRREVMVCIDSTALPTSISHKMGQEFTLFCLRGGYENVDRVGAAADSVM